MTTDIQQHLDKTVQQLRDSLGDNLYSCCLYGSAVRGNFIEGVSDLNLIIILNESTPVAHQAIAQILGADRQIDPFILSRRGLPGDARAFAPKFASIKRNYRVLYGADPFQAVQLDPNLERFLCEQALRNLHLRIVYAFVLRGRDRGYEKFLVRSLIPIFAQFSEVLRLEGTTVPKEFDARIPLMEKEFKIDGSILRDLLAFKKKPQKLSEADAIAWHERLFPVIDAVVKWLELKWSQTR